MNLEAKGETLHAYVILHGVQIKELNMRRIFLFILLTAVAFSSCTQQTDDGTMTVVTEEIQQQVTYTPTTEYTDTQTLEPTATPISAESLLPTLEPRDKISLNDLESIYDYEVTYTDDNGLEKTYNVYEELSDIDKERLLELYNEFGITMVFDMGKYGGGRFSDQDSTANVSPEKTHTLFGRLLSDFSYFIEVSYTFFNYIVDIGGDVMKQWIDVSLSYVYPTSGLVGLSQSTPENGGEITIEFECSYTASDYIFGRYLEELTNLFVESGSLDRDKFLSYNYFGSEYGGTWIEEYNLLVEDDVFKSDSDKYYFLHNEGGLISTYGFYELNNDWAEYQLGLWYNYGGFWNQYYNCESVRLKTEAQLEQYQKINPIFTIEFFYEYSCPWADEYSVDDINLDFPDITYVYDYIEENCG